MTWAELAGKRGGKGKGRRGKRGAFLLV